MDNNENKKIKIKKEFISGTGRRKTAVARVFVWSEKGGFTVNDMDINDYFPSEKEKIQYQKPFHTIGISHPTSKFNISAKVEGSGKSAQLDALVHGVSRALAKMDNEYKDMLSKQGLLTRDPRMVERKKYNKHKARKAHQYSKR